MRPIRPPVRLKSEVHCVCWIAGKGFEDAADGVVVAARVPDVSESARSVRNDMGGMDSSGGDHFPGVIYMRSPMVKHPQGRPKS